MPRPFAVRFLAALAVALGCLTFLAAPPAGATDSTWTSRFEGGWSDAANWSNGVPNGIGDVARFAGLPGVTIESSTQGAGIVLGTLYLPPTNPAAMYSGKLSIKSSSEKKLIFDSNSGAALIQVMSYSSEYVYYNDVGPTINAPVVLNVPLTVEVLGKTLTIARYITGGAGITKTGPGLLVLAPDANNDPPNTYGPLVISEGIVCCRYSGYSSSKTVLNGGVLDNGGFRTSTFTPSLRSGIEWTASGGFGASKNYFTINIDGNAVPSTVTWGVGGFVPIGCELVLGAPTSADTTELMNPIDFGGRVGIIRADSVGGFLSTTYSVLSGRLSNGGLTKVGNGTLSLTAANAYVGATTVSEGAVRAVDGIGLPNPSNLILAGGVFINDADSATFTRGLGPGAGQVQWAGSGGFGSSLANFQVNIGGSATPETLVWGTNSFVLNDAELVLGARTTWLNPLNLGGRACTVRVLENTGKPAPVLAGAITGAAGSALVKTGPGTLLVSATGLVADNVDVVVSEGTLDFQSYSDTVGVLTLSGGTVAGTGVLTGSHYDV